MNRTFLSAVLLLTLFVFGSAATAFGDANWVSINGTTSPQKPSAVVLSSNPGETIIKFSTYGFWSENLTEDGVTYQALKLPGYSSTLDIGKAAIPRINELVGIPGSANVNVSVVDFKEVTLSGYNVHPFQTPLKETEKRLTFDIDKAFYQQNAYYPEAQASVGDPAIWRDIRLVNLAVNPLRYNPATGEIKACWEITVRLEYTGVSDVNVKGALKRPITDEYDRMYRKGVLNYEFLNFEVAPEVDAAYDYLIIAEDSYMDEMAPFVTWKTTQGLATNMVPISSVGSNPTSIKSYINTEYNANGIRYVLLVGNEGDIPGYTGYGFFSDYWYTLLEGSDELADLAIGRFCVANATHVINMVNKSVTFESNPPAGDWLTKSLLVANWELAPGKYQGCKEEIRTAYETGGNYSVLYPDFTTCYGASYANGGDEASNADVVAYFDEGFRLVNYRGHGDVNIWWYWNVYGENFELSDVAAINNGQLTPVVFSIACLNNDLLYNGITIGEAFTQADDAAVAYLGASDPSYTTPNHDYDKQLYALVFDAGVNAVGDASNEASVEVIRLWGTYGITNARMYLWLGDPSLQLIYGGGFGPPPPQLLSPDDGSYFDDPAQITLDWSDVAEATSYHVQIDDNSDFSSPVAEQEGVTASEWMTPELGQNIYYWRVRSSDGEQYGGWSEVWSIFVGIWVEAPTLYSPADGSRIRNAINVALQWYECSGPAGYTVEIDEEPDFSSPAISAYADQCSGGICTYYISPPLRPGTYYWRVKAVDEGWPWSEVWSFRLQGRVRKDAVDYGQAVPGEFVLKANYPNPFNPSTEVQFGLPHACHARLEILNILGQKVATLVDGNLEAGYHTYTWNGSNAASGVYLYRLVTDDKIISRTMLLVK
ncbi:MAG: T9SS type A sorting domain-containing protein [Candidatus Zixiibacteriota bacterium]|nr:MAG: T9SS type A sorting domain-containing protein [candidate division Zixibacteria bacterium]